MTISYLEKKRHNKWKKGLNYNLHIPRFGAFGIKTLGLGRLEEKSIILLERLLIKSLKYLNKNFSTCKYWNNIQINSNSTKLNPESRMGKGKGSLHKKFAIIKAGSIIFELSGISEMQATLIWKQINSKINFPTKLVK